MLINLVLFQPKSYTNGRAFAEVMLLYAASLRQLGHQVEQSVNQLSRRGLNLIFAWHFLPEEDTPEFFGYDYVVIQLEALSPIRWAANPQQRLFEALQPMLREARAIWDYAPENLVVLEAYGLRGRLMPLGYNEALLRYRPWPEPDLDVIFIGMLTPRRQDLLKRLEPFCRLAWAYGCYASERDALFARSKLVLNLHAYDHLHQLEQVRVFDLFANRMLVVSESCSWQPYGQALISYDYDWLIEGVLDWLGRPEPERRRAADAGHEALRQIPFRAMLEQVLGEL